MVVSHAMQDLHTLRHSIWKQNKRTSKNSWQCWHILTVDNCAEFAELENKESRKKQ